MWQRSAKLGLVVGVIQVALNQGDHWLAHEFTSGVLVKSFLSPALSMSIALTAAASTYRLTGGGKTNNT